MCVLSTFRVHLFRSFLSFKSLPFYFEPISSSARRDPFPRNRRAKLDPQFRQLFILTHRVPRVFILVKHMSKTFATPQTFSSHDKKSKTIERFLLTDDKSNSFFNGKREKHRRLAVCLLAVSFRLFFTQWRSPLLCMAGCHQRYWRNQNMMVLFLRFVRKHSNPFGFYYRPTIRVVTSRGLHLIYIAQRQRYERYER